MRWEEDAADLVANNSAQRARGIRFSEVLKAAHCLQYFDERYLIERLDQLQTAIREFFVAANTVHGANNGSENAPSLPSDSRMHLQVRIIWPRAS